MQEISIENDLRAMSPEAMKEFIRSLGEPAYRADQLFDWVHKRQAASFEEMNNLPKKLRETLSEKASLTTLRPVEVLTSEIDGTRKALFALSDDNIIETVWMEYAHGNSVCISTQVGCRMGCRFCASTLGGVVRNLTCAEMAEQIYRIQAITGKKASNCVLMGAGEPLDNYEQVVRFLRLISLEKGQNMSLRNITVSTCGLPDRIRALAEEGLPVTLALSLHASSQETREKLMPIAKKYALPEVLAACDDYFKKTGRRMSYEYSLARGVNDTPADAEALAKLLSGKNCHVNLIPVNPVRERDLTGSSRSTAGAFQKHLEKMGINATIRREMGRDINGACGQLRRSFLAKESGSDQGKESQS